MDDIEKAGAVVAGTLQTVLVGSVLMTPYLMPLFYTVICMIN